MKKIRYTHPQINVIRIDVESFMLRNSEINAANGTIHTNEGNENIGTGREDDGGGEDASAKQHTFFAEW